MMKRFYIQTRQNEKLNLSELLQTNLKFSKELSEKLIYQGSVWNSKKNQRLKDKNKKIENELVLINVPEFSIDEYTLSKENIKYEDQHFIIVYKEAGLNTCPHRFPTLIVLHTVFKNIIIKIK